MTREQLMRMIPRVMEREWLATDPTPECFDHDEGRMKSLLDFLNIPVSGYHAETVRRHLVDCARCRYLYARLRETL